MGGQGLYVGEADVGKYTKALLLGFYLRLAFLLLENAAIQSQLPAENDVLLNKKSLFAATQSAASNL